MSPPNKSTLSSANLISDSESLISPFARDGDSWVFDPVLTISMIDNEVPGVPSINDSVAVGVGVCVFANFYWI